MQRRTGTILCASVDGPIRAMALWRGKLILISEGQPPMIVKLTGPAAQAAP